MKQEWVINIQRQCEQQNVVFFFKQWGGWELTAGNGEEAQWPAFAWQDLE